VFARKLADRVTAVLIATVALGVLPASAAAAVNGGDRGDHGAQGQCRYASTQVPGWSGGMRLKRVTVQPPTLFSDGGPGQVGWRMLVQHRYDSARWERIFASGIQRAEATPTSAAPFTRMTALIDSPMVVKDESGAFVGVDYRVILRFYWFAPDGSIERVERTRLASYDTFRDGEYLWTDVGRCHHAWIWE
jgi:hypothetical protein